MSHSKTIKDRTIIFVLAEAEGLTAHSMSLKERLEAKNIKA